MTAENQTKASEIASAILMGLGLIILLKAGLLTAFFSGLLVYSLVHMLTPLLAKKISSVRAKAAAVTLLGVLIVATLSLAIWGAVSFFSSDAGSVQSLLQKMADIIEASRHQMPAWLNENLPGSADALRETITSWLRVHATEAKLIGQQAGRTIVHLLLGMIIGTMVALQDTGIKQKSLPLAAAIQSRLIKLHEAFQCIVFAQIRIAAINAGFVAIYLFVVLPLAGIHLPLSKSLVAITFLAGLLPIVGNVMSNAVLVIVALAHSFDTAIASLLFMVLIHKLEYFLNARIISSRINAKAWELLVAILVMEALFGMSGVIAAPVFYAYLKKELADASLA